DQGAGRTPSRDDLDPDSARVLDALPTRGGAGTSTIAVEAGVDLDTVLRCPGGRGGYRLFERCAPGPRPPSPLPPPPSPARRPPLAPVPRALTGVPRPGWPGPGRRAALVASRDLGVHAGLGVGLVAKSELELQVALPGQVLQPVPLDMLGVGEADRPQPLPGQ